MQYSHPHHVLPVVSLQADLDLGNYERFLDVTLTRDNNLTTGKVYQVCHSSLCSSSVWSPACRQ